VRAFVLALVIVAAWPADAGHAAARCDDRKTRASVAVGRTERAIRTAVVVCHRGRRFVVARGVSPPGHARRADFHTDAAAAGRHAVWAVLRTRRARTKGIVTVARLRADGPRVVRRFVAHRQRRAVSDLTVQVTTRGELAWGNQWGLWVERRRGAARRVAKTTWGPLELEDDRTLRWGYSDDEFHYHDIRPWPAGRCPSRERFRTEVVTPDVIVTRAEYGSVKLDDARGADVLRACLRATGADPPVAHGSSNLAYLHAVGVVGVSGPWVVIAELLASRTGLGAVDVHAARAGTGATGRRTRIGNYSSQAPATPTAPGPVAVTERGVPAWLVTDDEGSRLYAISSAGEPVLLDSGAAGTIGDLHPENTRIAWTHAGEPRSAEVP
jgi:hypothetical protein